MLEIDLSRDAVNFRFGRTLCKQEVVCQWLVGECTEALSALNADRQMSQFDAVYWQLGNVRIRFFPEA